MCTARREDVFVFVCVYVCVNANVCSRVVKKLAQCYSALRV